MKTTMTTIVTAFIMMLSFNSFASIEVNPLKNLSSSKIVIAYLEAATEGSLDMNKYLFSDDFIYLNSASNKSYTKREYTAFLKANKGLKYDCETSYEILDECGKACVAKVSMKFKTFTRIDYVSLSQGADGWKVSKVVTSFS